MPNVVGKTKDEASKTLKDLGLKVTVETKASTQKEGTVIEQSKKEGTELSANDSVTITVSSGKKAERPSGNNEIKNEEVVDPVTPETNEETRD